MPTEPTGLRGILARFTGSGTTSHPTLDDRIAPVVQRFISPVTESITLRRYAHLSEQRLMAVPQWQRQAVAALIMVGVTMIAWRMTVAPELDRYRSTQMLSAARERLLEIGVAQAQRSPEIEVGGKRLPERLAHVRHRFFAGHETAALVESLGERARERGLDWIEVQVGTAKPLTQLSGFGDDVHFEEIAAMFEHAAELGFRFSTLQISFEVVGSPLETLGLLEEIERHPRLVQVEVVDMRQESRGRVRSMMVFNTILLDGGEEEHEGETGSRPGLYVDDHRVGGAVSPSD